MQMTRMQMVRQILLQEWDPVGVGDNTYLAGEYDHYIPSILHLIETGCSAKDLFDHLLEIEEGLGLRLPDRMREKAATTLFNLTE